MRCSASQCAAFTHGRRLANHAYFIAGGGAGPGHSRRPPITATAVATQPQVLQATGVQPTFEEEIPTLAPGEVMAGSVRNPVAEVGSSSEVVMATCV